MTRFVTLTAVLLPFLEIPGFILVAMWIGVLPTLVLVIGGAIAGILVLQRVGLNAVVSLRLALARGEEPGHSLVNSACFALAGFLLTIPGFISDLMALALFLPWTRDYLLRRVAGHFNMQVYRTHIHGVARDVTPPRPPRPPGTDRRRASRVAGSGIIDGEYSVIEPDQEPPDQEQTPQEESGQAEAESGKNEGGRERHGS
jgi:UPF0716 protein FxsA